MKRWLAAKPFAGHALECVDDERRSAARQALEEFMNA